MKGFIASLTAETVSLRDPEGQLYHSCLPLPSFSTMVGIAGAAMGMDFKQALEFFKINKVFVGTCGTNNGSGRDLWNYSKIVGSTLKKDIIHREFWVGVRLKLFYACEYDNQIEQIRKAFLDPTYCLTIGSSDDLVLIDGVSSFYEVTAHETTDFIGEGFTLIPGDVSSHYDFDWEAIKQSPLSVTLRGPVVKTLPVDFAFNKKVRKGSRYETFSFVPAMIKLRNPITVYSFGEYKIPLFVL